MNTINIHVILPSYLPAPDLLGGAIEGLVTILINQNEINKQFNFNIYINSHLNLKVLKLVSDKYSNVKIHFIKPNLFSFIFKYLHILLNKFNIRINLMYFPFILTASHRVNKINNRKNSIVLVEGNILHTLIANFVKIPVVFHMHTDYIHFDPFYFKKYLGIFNRIILVSEFLQERIINKFNIDINKTVILKNTIDSNVFNKKINIVKNVNHLFSFGYVGRISEEKGFFLFLDAFSRIKNENIRLLIYGSLSNNEKQVNINQFNKTLSLDKRIVYHGYIDRFNLGKIYKNIDLLVFPSTGPEAAGLVPLEALYFNTPVLASPLGGIKEYLDHKFVFFIKNLNSVEDFKNELEFYSNNKSIVTRIKTDIKNNFKLKTPYDYYVEFTDIIKKIL